MAKIFTQLHLQNFKGCSCLIMITLPYLLDYYLLTCVNKTYLLSRLSILVSYSKPPKHDGESNGLHDQVKEKMLVLQNVLW